MDITHPDDLRIDQVNEIKKHASFNIQSRKFSLPQSIPALISSNFDRIFQENITNI